MPVRRLARLAARASRHVLDASVSAARAIGYALLSRTRFGSLVVVEQGRGRQFGTSPVSAKLLIHSPRAWPALLRGSIGIAHAYGEAWIDSPDLVALIRLAARNGSELEQPAPLGGADLARCSACGRSPGR